MRSRHRAILLTALFALNAADCLTTLVGLSRGFHEGAPLAGGILGALGPSGLVLMGFIGYGIEVAVLLTIPRMFRGVAWAMILCVSAVPVVSNLGTLLG
ncbi:MAG: hypothetical protein QOF11_2709 [Chloroflexota bacterium]|nr:hypothetical protein [Chloroflexota bacterium]